MSLLKSLFGMDKNVGVSQLLLPSLFTLNTYGYYCLLFYSVVTLSINTEAFSIPYRVATLGLNLLVLFWVSFIYKGGRLPRTTGVYLFYIFWCFYSLRICYDALFQAHLLNEAAWRFPAYAFGMCLVPSLLFLKPISIAQRQIALRIFVLVSLTVSALIVVFFKDRLGTEFTRIRGKQSGEVNPLLCAYLGALLLNLAAWFPFVRFKILKWIPNFVISLPCIYFGYYCFVLGSSRGSVFSLVFSFLMLLYGGFRQKRWGTMLFFLPLIVGAGIYGFALSVDLGGALAERLGRLSLTYVEGEGGNDRLILWSAAWNVFINNPLTGGGLQLFEAQHYPHNSILESLMATGVFGGIVFIGLYFICFYYGFKIMRSSLDDGWIPIFCISNLVQSQFSGALYTNVMLWVSITLVLSTAACIPKNKSPLNSSRLSHGI